MRSIAFLSLFLFLVLPPTGSAQDDILTLDEAVQSVRERSDVRVLSAETVNIDGKRMYKLKVLTGNGRVKYVWVDPEG